MTIKQQGGIFGRNPTFNDVEVEGTLTATGTVSVPADSISGNAINGGTATLDGLTVDTTTFHVDSSNNRIGVGTTSPIAVVDVDMGVGGARRLLANYDDSIVSLKSSNASANPETLRLIGGNIRFNTGGSGSGSEIARVTDNGITFNGDTAAANALDDYEEGTFTPTITSGAGSFSSITYDSARSGRYTKVGNLVHFQIRMRTDAISVGTASGAVVINGLPFTSVNEQTSCSVYSQDMGGESPITGQIQNSDTVLVVYYYSGTSYSILDVTDLATGGNSNYMFITGTYTAA